MLVKHSNEYSMSRDEFTMFVKHWIRYKVKDKGFSLNEKESTLYMATACHYKKEYTNKTTKAKVKF